METGTHIAIKDFLAEYRPNHLRTGFHVRGVGEPAGVVGEASTVKEGAAQPNKNDSQVTEVGRKNLSADLFEIAGVAIEVVSVGVEVPNPGCGFGTFGKAAIEMAGLTEQFEGGRVVHPVDLGLRRFPTLWWADGHREVPRGTGSRWRSTLLVKRFDESRSRQWSHGRKPRARAMDAGPRKPAPTEAKTAFPDWRVGPQ